MPVEEKGRAQVRLRLRGRSAQYVVCAVSEAAGATLTVQVPRGREGLPWVAEGTEVELLQRDGLHAAQGVIVERGLRPVPSYTVALRGADFAQVAHWPQEGQAVLVTGGKGGAGKTFVATGLALLLSQQGYRVLLLDADLGTADVAVALGLGAEPHLGQVLDGRVKVEEALRRAVRQNLDVLPGAMGAKWVDPSVWRLGHVLTLVQQLRADYDYVLLDSRAGVGSDVTTLFSGVDRVLFVTADEPAGFADTRSLLQTFGALGRRRVGALVVNRVHSYRSSVDRLLRFQAEIRRAADLELPIWGVLQDDPRNHQLTLEGRLLVEAYPLAPTTVALRQVAARVKALQADRASS